MNTNYNVEGAFEKTLKHTQLAPFWKSKPDSPEAKELQQLLDNADKNKTVKEGKFIELDNKIKEFAENGHFFRLTEGKFYEVIPGENREVNLKIQVKEGTITWYFPDAGHDETTQEFRNQVFRTAALGHFLVPDACAKYYRGTNSMHVKKMHTSENESKVNHNHYRVKNDSVTLHQFEQHLEGFIKAEEAYGIKDKFLDKEEAQELVAEYKKFNEYLNQIPDGSTKTNREIYRDSELQKWTEKDFKEMQAPDAQLENPCEAVQIEVPLNSKVVTLEGENHAKLTFLPKQWPKFKDFLGKNALDELAFQGSFGMSSEIAQTRQMKQSTLPKQLNAYTRIGELFTKQQVKNYPKIPETKTMTT